MKTSSLCGTVYSSLWNRRRAGNKRRVIKIWQKNKPRALNTHMIFAVNNRLNILYVLSNKAVGPGIKSKINKRSA